MGLKVNNLCKKYKGQENFVLKDASFEIRSGEIVGLIGKNGSGKTTLLKMIAKALMPTSGEVYYDGVNIYEEANSLRDFGILITPTFYEHLTVVDNLKFYLAIHNLDKHLSNIQNTLQLVDLWEKKDYKPSTFSFGMKQRLSLAIALVSNPKFLILDEPFVGLDPVGVKQLIEILKKSAVENNVTMIISSHQLAELEDICHRYLFLQDGILTEASQKKSYTTIFLKKPVYLKDLIPEHLVNQIQINDDNNIVTFKSNMDYKNLNQIFYYLSEAKLIKSVRSTGALSDYFQKEESVNNAN